MLRRTRDIADVADIWTFCSVRTIISLFRDLEARRAQIQRLSKSIISDAELKAAMAGATCHPNSVMSDFGSALSKVKVMFISLILQLIGAVPPGKALTRTCKSGLVINMYGYLSVCFQQKMRRARHYFRSHEVQIVWTPRFPFAFDQAATWTNCCLSGVIPRVVCFGFSPGGASQASLSASAGIGHESSRLWLRDGAR